MYAQWTVGQYVSAPGQLILPLLDTGQLTGMEGYLPTLPCLTSPYFDPSQVRMDVAAITSPSLPNPDISSACRDISVGGLAIFPALV